MKCIDIKEKENRMYFFVSLVNWLKVHKANLTASVEIIALIIAKNQY